MTVLKMPYGHSPFSGAPCDGASFTIGAESSNVINVAIQLKSGTADLAERAGLLAYFSTDATGDTKKGTDANMSVAGGTDGHTTELVADFLYFLVSESDGDIDVAITKTDAGSVYLNLILPTGQIVTSAIITFT